MIGKTAGVDMLSLYEEVADKCFAAGRFERAMQYVPPFVLYVCRLRDCFCFLHFSASCCVWLMLGVSGCMKAAALVYLRSPRGAWR